MNVTSDAHIIDFIRLHMLRNIKTTDDAPISVLVHHFAIARYRKNDKIFWKCLNIVPLTDFQLSTLLVGLNAEYNDAILTLKHFYGDTGRFVANGDEPWSKACASLSRTFEFCCL